MNAVSELNFSRPGSATPDHPVQDTAPSIPPKNSSNVAERLNDLEAPSQYTGHGVAISIAQQNALYREYLHAQLQQPVSDRRVDQAHILSGSDMMNPLNQALAHVQNVALPPLQLPMQPPPRPTFVIASSNSNIF